MVICKLHQDGGLRSRCDVPLGEFQVLRNAFFWKIDTHPPSGNANNIESYTFQTIFSGKFDTPTLPQLLYVKRGSSEVECRTRNRDSPGLTPPFATVLKFGHFHSLHDGSVHSGV